MTEAAPSSDPGETKLAIVADVGRRAVRLGLTDLAGRLRTDTIRSYEPGEQSTISGAITAFARESGLTELPRRCAIAVAGAAVGDTIAVTNSRWIVSRSGLAAMTQAPPLILNDFAAVAWAMSATQGSARFIPAGGGALQASAPGTRALLGVGSGLGVAVMVRAGDGRVTILPTEAGHCHLMRGLAELEPVIATLAPRLRATVAEDLLSQRGVEAIYAALCAREGVAPRAQDAEAIIRLAGGQEPTAARTADLFARALWYFAGNLALAYGAWDGVIVTGSIATALRERVRAIGAADDFAISGPYQRQLRPIPRAIAELPHAELHGAAQALLAR